MEGWISNFDYRIPNLICDIGQCVTATSCNRVETGYESLLFGWAGSVKQNVERICLSRVENVEVRRNGRGFARAEWRLKCGFAWLTQSRSQPRRKEGLQIAWLTPSRAQPRREEGLRVQIKHIMDRRDSWETGEFSLMNFGVLLVYIFFFFKAWPCFYVFFRSVCVSFFCFVLNFVLVMFCLFEFVSLCFWLCVWIVREEVRRWCSEEEKIRCFGYVGRECKDAAVIVFLKFQTMGIIQVILMVMHCNLW